VKSRPAAHQRRAWTWALGVALTLGPLQAQEEDFAIVFSGPFLTAEFLEEVRWLEEEERIEQERIDRVFLDPKKRLMWTNKDNGRDIDWRRANRYCQELDLAGYTDWRLPTLEELEGLHRTMSQAQFKLPAEIRLTACCPWSSTLKDDDSVWNFNFQFRKPFAGAFSYTYDQRALCVREPTLEDSG